MRRVSKRVGRILFAIGVLVAVVSLGVWVLAPEALEWAVREKFRQWGLSEVQMDVADVGLRQTTFENLRLGSAGRLTVERMRLGYSLGSLFTGELQTLELIGARWEVRVNRRAVDLGPLQPILERRRGETDRDGGLPVGRIDVRASELLVFADGRAWHIPVRGTLERTSAGLQVDLFARPLSTPVTVQAKMIEQPRLHGTFLVTARPPGQGSFRVVGAIGADGDVDLEVEGHALSGSSIVEEHLVAVRGFGIEGRASLSRSPWRFEALELQLGADALQVDDLRLRAPRIDVRRAEGGLELDGEWAASTPEEHRGTLGCRGIPARFDAQAWARTQLRCRTRIDAATLQGTLDITAGAEVRLHRSSDDTWAVEVESGTLEVAAERMALADGAMRLQGLRARAPFVARVDRAGRALTVLKGAFVAAERLGWGAGSIERPRLELEALRGESPVELRQQGSASPTLELDARWIGRGRLNVRDWRGEVETLVVELEGQRVDGQWDLRSRSEARIGPLVHPPSGARIQRVAMSLPLRYPERAGESIESGRLRFGPVHWRDAVLPALTGTLARRDQEIVASLRWPVTDRVVARGRARLSLDDPVGARAFLSASSFDIAKSKAVAALMDATLGGEASGEASFEIRVRIDEAGRSETVRVALKDVAVSRPNEFFAEFEGITGRVDIDDLTPPTSPGAQRLDWKGGRVGPLELGRGHIVFSLERAGSLLVEEASSLIGPRGRRGELFVGALRYEPDDPRLELDVFVRSISLQSWLDLLGRDEVEGTGTLHGHVSAQLRLEPTLQVRLEDGLLLAEPGGTLSLRDVQAAKSVLASSDLAQDPASRLQTVVQRRLLEALQSLEYSSLRFELLREDDEVTLQAHIAGRGTKGARQEIGGLTINVKGFESALNRILRLRKAAKEVETSLARR